MLARVDTKTETKIIKFFYQSFNKMQFKLA